MATLGEVDIDCTICGLPLHVPIIAMTGPVRSATTADALAINIDLDREYLRAHAATHAPDNEPVLVAVA